MENPPQTSTESPRPRARQFRYYDIVMAAFVAVLLLSNVIGAAKLSTVAGFTFGAGILFFPVSYVIGDVLTEVYGYAKARRAIWVGFVALIFMAFMSWAVVAMPPAASWGGQSAYEAVFGQVPRIVLASILAFWAGEFVNSYILARMKSLDHGQSVVEPHHRIDHFRPGCRQSDILSGRLSGHLGNPRCCDRDGQQLGAESAVGSGAYALHLCGGRQVEAGGRGGDFRHGN